MFRVFLVASLLVIIVLYRMALCASVLLQSTPVCIIQHLPRKEHAAGSCTVFHCIVNLVGVVLESDDPCELTVNFSPRQ